MKQQISTDDRKENLPDRNTVIGLFRLRGTTLTHWCNANGISQAYAQLSMTGLRKGPTALRIVRMIRAELGL